MRRVLLAVMLAVWVAGFVKAQQTTGAVAEQARKEVLQFEHDKVPLLLKGGSAFADWFASVNADDVVIINGNGTSPTKAEQVEIWRSGEMKQLANNQHDHHVYIYNNGNTAVVTYVGTTTNVIHGKTVTNTVRCADTWVKQDGKWLRVVHANVSLHPQ